MSGIKENTVKADNQVKTDENVFYLGENGLKVLILGNSITRHGICPEIGWYGLYGMAASSIEKDYVHLLYKRINERIKTNFMVCQLAEWERTYKNFDFNKISAAKDFNPDVIVFRLGENVGEIPYDAKKDFAEKLEELIAYLSCEDTHVVFTTCFWENPVVDAAIKEVCEKMSGSLVELNDLGRDPAMKAIGLFEHTGVAAHPGDKGMYNISERIYKAIEKTIKE